MQIRDSVREIEREEKMMKMQIRDSERDRERGERDENADER